MKPLSILLLAWLCGLPAAPALAIEKQALPEPLKPWADWALGEDNQYDCPFAFQDFQQKHCSWPGILKLNLNDNGGRFSGEWQLYRSDWLILPGDAEHWPLKVNVNHQPAVVVTHDGKPAIRLPSGHYQIDGSFSWNSLPENLALAHDTGLVELTLNNQPIAMPRIEQHALWPAPAANQPGPDRENSIDVQVFRQIVDAIPLQAITQLELDVSGNPREIALPLALLPQFTPISLESPLPARLEADGRLSLQVKPGHWSLTLTARYSQSLDKLELPEVTSEFWPRNELWSFQAMPEIRLVEIEGLPAIDASQSNLPEAWRHLPTYQIQAGQAMQFKTVRRGDAEPEPNQLRLQRRIWLDFDGEGYTVSDRINGRMNRDWRLNAVSPMQLGQALLNGRNQLITLEGERDQGIEIRRGIVDLQADSRIQADRDNLNAVGWQQSFQQAGAELNIPPGWLLLAVSGVDNDPASWLTQWTLLDLFLVLVTALAVARLWDWHWGALALLSLALIWHEPDAPRWIWLNTLATMALLRVMPENRFTPWLRGYRNLCWLGLLAIAIPFMVEQCRIGLYPQLQRSWQEIANQEIAQVDVAETQRFASMPMEAESMVQTLDAASPLSKPKSLAKSRSLAGSEADFERVDPNANLQTGPGLPQWQWQRIDLSWNGVVDQHQQIGLWLLSPAWVMLLHFVQALLTGILVLRLLDAIAPNWRPRFPALGLMLLLPMWFTPVDDSRADFPDPALLEQLKTRLQQTPACLPECAQLAELKVSAARESLQLELELHAQQALALPLPVQLEQWYPALVDVDGHPAQGLMRQDDHSLWLMLPAGVHRVTLKGRYSPRNHFSLPLPMPPGFTRIDSEGWQVEGVYENGKAGSQLEFNRSEQDAKNTAQPNMPPFVEVERTLVLDLDWKVVTRISNLGDSQSSVMLEIPLLPGEAVISEQIRVKDGKVLVNMAAGETQLEWQSTLERREQLRLEANADGKWSDVWRADVSPIWHLQAKGIPVIRHQDDSASWLPEWRPWPGEAIDLNISRPSPVAGATITVDKSLLQVYPGKRSQKAELSLDLRSSKGGQHTIILPNGAVLQNATINGTSQPIRQQENRVTLPIQPGLQHIHLSWQTTESLGLLLDTPQVDLGIASVNSYIQAFIGEDRWVLLTFGPKFGPAALIWGLLIVLLLVALGLHRMTLTPLKHWQWFLLLIGLSQLQIFAALLVVGWLLALGLRGRRPPAQDIWFNFLQIGLALLSVCSIMLLFAAVQQGLLGGPNMQITGNQSTPHQLNWYQDRNAALLPTALVVSVPMMLYRLLMLAWALWMALSLLDWLRWGWSCFTGGGIWRKKPATQKA